MKLSLFPVAISIAGALACGDVVQNRVGFLPEEPEPTSPLAPPAQVDAGSSSDAGATCPGPCPLYAACREGACVCPSDYPTACGGACVDTREDSDHCGACGNRCANGAWCADGACRTATVVVPGTLGTSAPPPSALVADATHLYFTVATDAAGRVIELRRVPLAGGAATTLAADVASTVGAALAVDDQYVYYAGLSGRTVQLNASYAVPGQHLRRVPKVGGPSQGLTDDARPCGAFSCANYAPGRIALANGYIYWVGATMDGAARGLVRAPLVGGPWSLVVPAAWGVATNGSDVFFATEHVVGEHEEYRLEKVSASVASSGAGTPLTPLGVPISMHASQTHLMYAQISKENDGVIWGLDGINAIPAAGGAGLTVDDLPLPTAAVHADAQGFYWINHLKTVAYRSGALMSAKPGGKAYVLDLETDWLTDAGPLSLVTTSSAVFATSRKGIVKIEPK